MSRRSKPDRSGPVGSRTQGPAGREEVKYHGMAACIALWRARQDDLIRIYVTEATLGSVKDVLKWAAVQKKAYHVVGDDDLERLTGSIHHQGICMLALEKPRVDFTQFLMSISQRRDPQLVAWLDGVRNSYNMGAIVRTCAHFGVGYVLGEEARLPAFTVSANRVAMGGAEQVSIVRVDDRDKAFSEIRRMGFTVLSTDSRGESVFGFNLPRRTMFVMGSETAGVSPEVRAHASGTISIPGSGKVESLNVSVAFGVLASEFRRRHVESNPRPGMHPANLENRKPGKGS